VFVFSVILCDNAPDRDHERFTVGALHKLAELFVGKTGIFDHAASAKNQAARIFAAEVECDDSQQTAAGEPYHRLKARAYMPKTAGNAELIAEIDAGIKKEVSVSCAVASVTCSVCGAVLKGGQCEHLPGRTYVIDGQNRLCHRVLDDPTDAYEWSFVAVPAQPGAGVTKGFDADVTEKLQKTTSQMILSAAEAAGLRDYISELETFKAAGELYQAELRSEVKRLCALSLPEFDPAVVTRIAAGMTMAELISLKSGLLAGVEERFPLLPQLATGEDANAQEENGDFLI